MEEDFCLREDAYLTFPSEVNDFTTREAIEYFQVNIENTVKHMDHICCYCSRFVDQLELKSISDNNEILMAVFQTNTLHYYDLDVCDCCSGSFNFSHDL